MSGTCEVGTEKICYPMGGTVRLVQSEDII